MYRAWPLLAHGREYPPPTSNCDYSIRKAKPFAFPLNAGPSFPFVVMHLYFYLGSAYTVRLPRPRLFLARIRAYSPHAYNVCLRGTPTSLSSSASAHMVRSFPSSSPTYPSAVWTRHTAHDTRVDALATIISFAACPCIATCTATSIASSTGSSVTASQMLGEEQTNGDALVLFTNERSTKRPQQLTCYEGVENLGAGRAYRVCLLIRKGRVLFPG